MYRLIVKQNKQEMKNSIEIKGSKNQVIAVLKVKEAPKKKSSSKIIEHRDIRSRFNKNREISHSFNADINLKEQTIRIFGVYTNRKEPVTFDRTFKTGDEVEVDSWNLTFTGEIKRISANTILVDRIGENKRMKLHEFIDRNFDLDLDKIMADNAEARYYI